MTLYHGGRHSTNALARAIWQDRNAMVSFADAPNSQVEIAFAVGREVIFDNGAFSVWRQGISIDWADFYRWVNRWRRPALRYVLIPDVIDGGEPDNDALLRSCPLPRWMQLPVWHLHESIDRLKRLRDDYERVALGSSGKYRTPGAMAWWGRMDEAMEVLCDSSGFPLIPFHGLRQQNPALFAHVPYASADSAMVSRSIGTTNWGGCYQNAPDDAKAFALIRTVESAPCAQQWRGIPRQADLFGELTA